MDRIASVRLNLMCAAIAQASAGASGLRTSMKLGMPPASAPGACVHVLQAEYAWLLRW
jgi:hypothetical protein